MRLRLAVLVLMAVMVGRADHFDVYFTAEVVSHGYELFPSSYLRDLVGAFDMDGDTLTEFSAGPVFVPYAWYINSSGAPRPNGDPSEPSVGYVSYDRLSNTLNGFLDGQTDLLSIRPDGTWWNDGDGSLETTGHYRVTAVSTPEPATWLLLLSGAILLLSGYGKTRNRGATASRTPGGDRKRLWR